jgi:hypothetical protein
MLDRPRFSLVADEPVAAPARPADKFDTRAISRAAVRHWSVLRSWLVNFKGVPSGEILRLNPSYKSPTDPSIVRRDLPRLVELQGPSTMEVDGSVGAWHCRGGSGASGKDPIAMIEYLSQGADRRVCAEYLKSLTDRIVELAR